MPGIVKMIAGCVLAGATLLGVVAAAIAYYDLPPADRAAMWGTIGRALLWLGVVAVLPWATPFLTTAASRQGSNLAGVGLLAGYLVADAAILLLLVGPPAGAYTAVACALGLLVAAAYNLLVCDWVAERWT